MAAFAAVMSFIRMSVIGVPLPFGGLMRMSFASGLFSSVLTFAMGLIGLHLVGPGHQRVGILVRGTTESTTGVGRRQPIRSPPAWLGTALTFLPMGSLLQLIAGGIRHLRVCISGCRVMMRAKQAGAGGYTASVVACMTGVGIAFGIGAVALGATGRLAGH